MDITGLIVFLVALVCFGALLLRMLWPFIKTKLSAVQLALFTTVVEAAVYAAGKLKETGVIEDKAEYALDQINQWLAKHNITYDADYIKMILEAAVKRLDIDESWFGDKLQTDIDEPPTLTLKDEEGTYGGIEEVQQ